LKNALMERVLLDKGGQMGPQVEVERMRWFLGRIADPENKSRTLLETYDQLDFEAMDRLRFGKVPIIACFNLPHFTNDPALD
jgi:hypothetical protein